MAERDDLFKTKVVGGFSDEEMSKEIEKMQGDLFAGEKETVGASDSIAQKDAKILELRRRLDEKTAENEALRKDIREKYQSYIDNYESIGSLVYDAKIRAEQMIADAEEKRRVIIEEAEEQARIKIEAVQAEIDKRIDDGEQRYKAVEEELESIIGLINQVQRKFMESYKSIHNIVRDMPISNVEIDD